MPIDFIQGESADKRTHIFSKFLKKMTNLIKVKKKLIREVYDQKLKERQSHKD